jgi:hypothetical protein
VSRVGAVSRFEASPAWPNSSLRAPCTPSPVRTVTTTGTRPEFRRRVIGPNRRCLEARSVNLTGRSYSTRTVTSGILRVAASSGGWRWRSAAARSRRELGGFLDAPGLVVTNFGYSANTAPTPAGGGSTGIRGCWPTPPATAEPTSSASAIAASGSPELEPSSTATSWPTKVGLATSVLWRQVYTPAR